MVTVMRTMVRTTVVGVIEILVIFVSVDWAFFKVHVINQERSSCDQSFVFNCRIGWEANL